MPTVVMSPNPKVTKVFMNPNGTITEGGVEENINRSPTIRRTPQPNRDDAGDKGDGRKV
jgi:hypothetical protein